MATLEIVDDRLTVVTISRKDAADMIALLAGQLAGKPIQGNQGGACPYIIVDDGMGKRMTFVVDQNP